MTNKYVAGPQKVAATIEYNNDTDEAKVKFYINAREFAFIVSQGNLDKLLHEEGDEVGYLILDN